MSIYDQEDCPLCAGCGEVTVFPVGQPDSESKTVGCPRCIQLELEDDIKKLEAERDALRADATRYQWLKKQLSSADFGYGKHGALIFDLPKGARISLCLDSSIDGMMGNTDG